MKIDGVKHEGEYEEYVRFRLEPAGCEPVVISLRTDYEPNRMRRPGDTMEIATLHIHAGTATRRACTAAAQRLAESVTVHLEGAHGKKPWIQLLSTISFSRTETVDLVTAFCANLESALAAPAMATRRQSAAKSSARSKTFVNTPAHRR